MAGGAAGGRLRLSIRLLTRVFPLILVVLVLIVTAGIRIRPAGLYEKLTTYRSWSSSSNATSSSATDGEYVRPYSPALATRAVEFVQSRQDAHQAAGFGRHWRLRGVGYLREVHGLVLAAEPPQGPCRVGESAVVTIWDVNAAATRSDKTWTWEECNKFSLWIRVRGDEIFAGMAETADVEAGGSSGGCRWEYEFRPTIAGPYEIDAKILQWNGKVPRTDDIQCQMNNTGNAGLRDVLSRYPLHAGWQGFKMYTPAVSCCEFCARLHPHCQYWSSPPFNIREPSYFVNGCELYFAPETPENIIPRSHLHGDLNMSIWEELSKPNASLIRDGVKYEHGPPHRQVPAMHYAGCGWSNWFTLDFPCLSGDLDDKIFMIHNAFYVSNVALVATTPPAEQALPLCQLHEERTLSGRWVREPWNGTTKCPQALTFDANYNKRFDIVEYNGDQPHCWHRDDLSRIGNRCTEMNCRLITQQSKWISPMRDKWFGIWKPWNCQYAEFTDKELQKCIDRRQIASFRWEGRSIAEFLNEYLQQRLHRLHLYDATAKGVTVTISTKALLHHSTLTDEELIHHLQDMPNITAEQEYFVVGGFFLSSERDTYANAERIRVVIKTMEEVLTPKGYTYLDAFFLSAAFSFDTSTQFDGMHIIGPSMKMVIVKLFHHLCKDVVNP